MTGRADNQQQSTGTEAGDDTPGGGSTDGALPDLRIALLGGFSVAIGGRAVPEAAWGLQKARSLLKLLALAPAASLARDQIIDLLWPDFAPDAAANNLYRTLSAARRAIAPAGRLRLRDGLLTLTAPGGLAIDVLVFDAAVEHARRVADPAAYEAALALYAGDLLPEDRYDDWVVPRREALRERFHHLLLTIAGRYQERGDTASAFAALQRLIASDPIQESAHAALMRLYASDGQRAQAIRQYQQLRSALEQELDAEPLPATRRLYGDIVTGTFPSGAPRALVESPPPPIASPLPAVAAHNLPATLNSLVGREEEVAAVRAVLGDPAPSARLVTLVGIGGCGKTRLALAVAATMIDDFPGGAWFVELAPLAEPTLVAGAVVAVLGLREEPGQPTTETLVAALRTKPTLLVLDNCEHLIDAIAALAQSLLSRCPALRVLATSREALQLPGETIWRVPPLPLPSPALARAPTDLARNPAVGLLLDRIRARQPGFALTAENAPAVIEICRRLDGLPLALELAAARTGILTVEQVAARLDDALGLLSAGYRGAHTRQQTLRAALDWSHDLLTGPERRTLRRMAAFAGAWTIAAAEAVCAQADDPALTTEAILPLLAQLVDKSLILVERAGNEARYRLLEPVRQYALERQVASGEEEGTRARHAAHYLALAEAALPELVGPRQERWVAWLGQEGDNARAALRWAREADAGVYSRAAIGLRLAAALWRSWEGRGQLREARGWLGEFLALTAGDPDPATRAARVRASNGAAFLAYRQGDYGKTALLAEEARVDARALADTSGEAEALGNLGIAAYRQGDHDRAIAVYEESLALCRSRGDRRGAASALAGLGLVEQARDNFPRAAALLEEGLALLREAGDPRGVASVLNNLAAIHRTQGHYARATALSEESLAIFRQLGSPWGSAVALLNLAGVARVEGDGARATALYRESLTLYHAIGSTASTLECVEGLALIATVSGEARVAARLFSAAAALRDQFGTPAAAPERAVTERALAMIRAALGDEPFAAAWAAGQQFTLETAVAEALEAGDD